ncbi:2-polyprenyl-6-methoxyphenol hydroxylase-like FAD-dependent oxidoreductase [Nocardioides albertanoniae]|uniref:2-polyprenyl-6-methoxyphenol hydroxylase-like FAD-dependent oxidoreductase n=1 Tax=Nocardioides albertanoniae TaxID=1175486 RepID=A0A543A2Z4_9ACTN|nr:FAD-dependent oxidoreductase [Nocardioides albertanoniae]TQL66950.1 2-polyprenyl-6-methoxyphenol hydroxylase-like FAD-dependent oxidoreductase [Nocardioides albertanoniae]
MSTITTDVLVVGAGPTGLAVAAKLAAAGVDVTVIDHQATGDNTSRAAVVHARTLEVLADLDVSRRLVEEGSKAPRFTIRDRGRVLVPIRFDDLPSDFPYALMVSQAVTERVLLERLTELGGHVRRPLSLVDLAQDETGVTATTQDGTEIRARYLVGADGMHSTVRDKARIGFPGGKYAESFSLADVRLEGDLPHDEVILYFSPEGTLVSAPLPDGSFRFVAPVEEAPAEPDVDYVQGLLDRRGGRSPVKVTEVVWGSRFLVHHRVADTYRAGRVLIAGDAAHVHSPAGGQGMNTGLQDAVVLGDALVAVITGGDETALDDYGARRRPVAQEVVELSDRLTQFGLAQGVRRSVRNVVLSVLAKVPRFRRMLAWRLSGLVYRGR